MFGSGRLIRRVDRRELADEELMHLVREGEAGAFEVIFDRHGGASFSLAYRMCGRRALAEDVVQEAFLSLWRGSARYDPLRGSVRTWVLAAVRNRAIDALRRGAVSDRAGLDADQLAERIASSDRTEAEVVRREDANELRSALGELPSEQRQVIELAYFGGFTHTEIAEMLGLPIGTVKGRMRLGLTKMRLALCDPAEVTS
jgi:RNA polymerase sigma-70 factor (ECF subfamily)